MDNHPTVAELEGLVVGGNSAEHTRAVIAHLLRGCQLCRARLAPYVPVLFEGTRSRHGSPPPLPPETYDEAVDRAVAAALLRTPERRKQKALELLAAGGLEALADAPSYVQGAPIVEALLERSWALRHESPQQMVQLAQAAIMAADRLPEAQLGPEGLLELRCRAWTELGNARRVNDELDRAEEALGRALELYLRSRQEDLLGARLFTALASLYGDRRQFDLALTTFDLVADVYRRHGDGHLIGRTLIKKGIYTGYRGDAEEAIRLVTEGLSSVDEAREPRLVFSSTQNLARLLVDCGRFKDAQFVLWDLRQRRLDPGGHINELKLRWLEGHIFVGLEKLDRAERALQQVKQGFEEKGLRYKTALVGLELGAVWLRQRRNGEAAEMVLACTGVFLSLGIERELLASVVVLRRATETQRLTLEVLDSVIERLRRADRD